MIDHPIAILSLNSSFGFRVSVSVDDIYIALTGRFHRWKLTLRYCLCHQDFRDNSFEQLCINYANESLQYYFNEHIFRIEQAEYEKEQVTWVMIEFHDNRPVADVISRKPNGILQILDDESSFPSVRVVILPFVESKKDRGSASLYRKSSG